MTESAPTYHDAVKTLIVGSEAIAKSLPELAKAAAAWGQADEVMELQHWLDFPVLPRRTPLLLVLREAGEICGAVMVFAYISSFVGHKLLTNADRLGRRGIYGPSANRIEIAATAASEFFRRGAALVKFDLLADDLDDDPARANLLMRAHRSRTASLLNNTAQGLRWELLSRIRNVSLPLYPDLQQTLRGLGKRTRRNAAHHRRQCERKLGATFHMQPEITREDFLRLNSRSHYPQGRRMAEWRFAASQHAPAFLAGMKTADGKWIALLGGQRVGQTVVIHWQSNDLAYGPYSVSLVMRAFAMEHFGKDGAKWLCTEAGTRHVMSDSFQPRTVYRLHARRPAIWLRLLSWTVSTFFPSSGFARNVFWGFP